jgi:Holliday junction resolvasome RuvABC DNA-binding subunit
MADVVELTQDFINDCMVDYNQTNQTQKAFLATTVACQAHAVEALENLGFVPIKASNRITLWLKKAKGTRN